jgi:thiamine pyrophosphokinase
MTTGKSGLVITGGLAATKGWFDIVKKKFGLIVAADAGYHTAIALGADVDYVVGDMDSIGDRRLLEDLPKGSVRKFDEDKDFTDTEIGLELLKEKGCRYRCIFGGGGGRLDHLIGILSLFDRIDGPDMWITDSAVIVSISDSFVLTGMIDRTISFFPIGFDRCTMTSKGLKWPLDSLEWTKGDAGVSNLAISSEVKVTMRTGRLAFVGELETLKGIHV